MKLKRLIFFDFGIPLPGTGLRRRGAAHPAYSALFPGDGVLLLPIRPKNSTTGFVSTKLYKNIWSLL